MRHPRILHILVSTITPGAVAVGIHLGFGFEPAALCLLVMIAGSTARADLNTAPKMSPLAELSLLRARERAELKR